MLRVAAGDKQDISLQVTTIFFCFNQIKPTPRNSDKLAAAIDRLRCRKSAEACDAVLICAVHNNKNSIDITLHHVKNIV
jgi:hypothetical protein